MKKHVLSMLLCLCMIFTMLCGMAGVAYADETVKHTLKAGETVIGVCQKLGIDFYANQAWIMQTNNIANFNNLKAGMVLTLPTGKTPAAPAAAPAGGTAPATAGAGTYYLAEHTVAPGETVYAICQALGIDFAANSDRIKEINGIGNYNNVKAGTVLKLPTTTVPSGTYTTVVAHKVAAGETVMTICMNNGIDFASNQAAIKSLSGVDNLNVIRPGQTIYLPVKNAAAATVPAAAGGAAPAAAATTPAPVNTKAEAGAFTVHTSSNGVFHLMVNGQIVNSAKAGETVSVVTVPDQGYKVNDIIVYKTASTERVTVKNSSFTMPAYDITIYVTFRAG